jgi:hypothetical protein
MAMRACLYCAAWGSSVLVLRGRIETSSTNFLTQGPLEGGMIRSIFALLMLLVLLVPASLLHGQTCTITSNFNGTPIAGGDSVWFTSVFSVQGLGSQPVTVYFSNSSITVTVNGVPQTVPVPDGQITFSPDTTQATTYFDSTSWITNLQSSGLSGKDFVTAVAVQLPGGGWPGGIQDVSWSGSFTSNTDGLSVKWQWAAAVYTQFGADYNSLGVKPVDDNQGSQYQNSDHAGTPENFKQFVTGGARGGGGSNYTGSYSGTAGCPVGRHITIG